ncbi:MAG: S-methyl-5-thioribose-1-phosphate isomerase [Chloroflexi bacterium]|nr:S-methyl-5-thioribose-1-phosphate isomerase [Chloroflexota bacterium]
MAVKAIEWRSGSVRIIDQTRLPQETLYLELRGCEDVVTAIREMRIRGAPAIGIAGAYGLALASREIETPSLPEFWRRLEQAATLIHSSRPTAVNLAWALNRCLGVARECTNIPTLRDLLLREAQRIQKETEESDRRLSLLGAELIPSRATILTHCNTGPLATGGYGTAQGIIKAAAAKGKEIQVLATETRPLLQGARLTTWELSQQGIPVTLITDSAAGLFLKRGEVTCALVGADRIAANGDTANKIGTYTLAVLAHENQVPFYVAAPLSTLDLSLPSGEDIPIEERSPEEVTHIAGVAMAPQGTMVRNPAFDVTPSTYISAIVTEAGIARLPYTRSLKKLHEQKCLKSE